MQNNTDTTSISQQVENQLIEETNIEKQLFFSFDDTNLISVIEQPGLKSSRLILRNTTGKYCWDTVLFYESINKMGLKQASEMIAVASDYSPARRLIITPNSEYPKIKLDE
ncbi:hypothetical protein HK098_006865 [Nowakowskiella sp. JEL0407]|nr:hypothetical protein HK098_006865 [Nowakowskiella sp. JEL0407]